MSKCFWNGPHDRGERLITNTKEYRGVTMKRVIFLALFVALALTGQAYAYTCTGAVFNDVDAVSEPSFCAFIEEFATLGITSGCGSGNYCPDSVVDRGQMAVFFVRALDNVANSRYVNVTGDTMTGALGWDGYDIGLDSTNALTLWGPQAQIRLIGAPHDPIYIGGTTPCGLGPLCWDKIDIVLGDSDSDRVTLGTSDVVYVNPQTRYWSVNGEVFLPIDETNTYTNVNGALYSATGAYSAPVNLPHGATVTKMTVHYMDNDAADNFSIWLYQNTMIGALSTAMATFTTAGAAAAYQVGEDTTIAPAVIDNSQYAYRLMVGSFNGASTHRLGGVVIEYTVTSPLP
jgi:hypothetical protein